MQDKLQQTQAESEEKFLIHAYLSYRCKIDRDIEYREKLESICAGQGIKLIYDRNGTKEGDSLIKFMDDLTSARFVFVFLSPDYFQSAYTLYELVSIHERADLESRFILPVRLTDSIVAKSKTEIEANWHDGNAKADREKLAGLLNEPDQEALWKRIDAAWEAIVNPYLDKLHAALEQQDATKILSGLVQTTRETINEIVTETEQTLREKVKKEISRILKQAYIPTKFLAETFRLDPAADADNIAGYLAENTSVIDMLDGLYKVSVQRRASRPDNWEHFLYDIEQISGWLLINKVDPYWWFQNQLNVRKTLNNGLTGLYNMQKPAYIEVLISRNLVQSAQFTVDKYGDIKPASAQHDVMLFDGLSDEATDYELLSPIYKDLRPGYEAPQAVKKLIDGIVATAQSLKGPRDGKLIYYIVSENYLDMVPITDPLIQSSDNAEMGAARVVRGGSCFNNGGNVRSAYRSRNEPDNRNNNVGFRLALGHTELRQEQAGGTGTQEPSRPARGPDSGVAEQPLAGLAAGLRDLWDWSKGKEKKE